MTLSTGGAQEATGAELDTLVGALAVDALLVSAAAVGGLVALVDVWTQNQSVY